MSGQPQRQRILDSALSILAEQGPARLTVRAVGAAAGCSTTGIYTYFGGKPGLLDAIYADAVSLFRADVAVADEIADPADRLLTACRRYWAWALSHRTQYQLMFVTAQASFEPSPESVELAWAAFGDLVARVRDARPDLVGDAVEDAAHHLGAMLHGYVMLELVSVGTDEAEAAARFERGVQAVVGAGSQEPAGAS
ncbi:TetR/AcrR family transcriptional regulator [Cellulomonas rhizosphaerae]|uniref:TetR/AcrR family transcriptional regulator n=1 Tax=Cellulomonas rhizosphaerae TaxID=2293719 RepID=UPI0013142265|nr:TetR/AcrR family transcriptional regulator [Cellulomonas rhizosphaerae]